MSDVQHIIDDLTQVNTVVRHTATELHDKVLTLLGTVEDQYKADVAQVLELVAVIKQAAHSTASAAVIPDPLPSSAPILNPPVDLAQIAADASAAENAAAAAAQPPVTAEDLAAPATDNVSTDDSVGTDAEPTSDTTAVVVEGVPVAEGDAPKRRR